MLRTQHAKTLINRVKNESILEQNYLDDIRKYSGKLKTFRKKHLNRLNDDILIRKQKGTKEWRKGQRKYHHINDGMNAGHKK